MSKELPDKLSELLRLAVKDAKLCEEDSNYELNMSFWHQLVKDKCIVCLAGSVMAQTLELLPEEVIGCIEDSGFCLDTKKKLTYIDMMRSGLLPEGVPTYIGERFSFIVSCDWKLIEGRTTWRFYLMAADYLESEGL